MMQSSAPKNRLCLVWTTQRPSLNSESWSSTFPLFDSAWYLTLMYAVDTDSSAKPYYYKIILNQEHTKRTWFFRSEPKKVKKCFHVTTFIENVVKGGFTSLGYTTEVKTTNEVIWTFEQEVVAKNTPFISKYHSEEFNVVCLFHDVQSNETIHLRDRNDLDLRTSVEFTHSMESLSTDFSNLLEDKAFPDVELRCGDRTIPAHKTVLAARSEVFAAMFRNRMAESETGVVDLTDVELQILDLFLKYLYSGKLEDLPDDILPGLYEASDKYAVQALKKACSNRMIRCLTEENCVNFLVLADAHSDFAFKEAVISVICENDDLFESEDWLRFSKEYPNLSNEIYHRFFKIKRKKL